MLRRRFPYLSPEDHEDLVQGALLRYLERSPTSEAAQAEPLKYIVSCGYSLASDLLRVGRYRTEQHALHILEEPSVYLTDGDLLLTQVLDALVEVSPKPVRDVAIFLAYYRDGFLPHEIVGRFPGLGPAGFAARVQRLTEKVRDRLYGNRHESKVYNAAGFNLLGEGLAEGRGTRWVRGPAHKKKICISCNCEISRTSDCYRPNVAGGGSFRSWRACISCVETEPVRLAA